MVEAEGTAPILNYELKGEWFPGAEEEWKAEIAWFNDPEFPPITPETVPAIREMSMQGTEGMNSADHPIYGKYLAKITEGEFTIDGGKYGSNNKNLRIFTYQVKGKEEEKNRKGIIYLHLGGCYIFSANDTHYGCRRTAVESDCVVFSIDFRNAPETKAPQNYLDSYAGVKYIIDHSEEWGLDQSRICITGESGGAYHVVGVCMQLAKINEAHLIKLAIVDIPMISDFYVRTPPIKDFRKTELSYKDSHTMEQKLLATDWEKQVKERDPDLFPGLMSDELLQKVPPTIVMSREFCFLRRGAEEYADRLKAKGKLLEYYIMPGTHHYSQIPEIMLQTEAAYDKLFGAYL